MLFQVLRLCSYREVVDIVMNWEELENKQSKPKLDYHLNCKIKSKLYAVVQICMSLQCGEQLC